MVRQLTQAELDEFNTRQADIIVQLQKIQNMELDLYGQLEANIAAGGDSAARDAIVAKIQTLSDNRMDMYRDLMDNYEIIRQTVGQTRGDLVDQMTLIDVVQQQLDSLRRQTGDLSLEKSGKERMIEINTYYGKKYMAQKELMQMIILTCVPLLILALLAKFGSLANQLASVLGAIILIVGLYFIFRKIIDINSRSNQVFDEYDWAFDPAALHPTVIEYDMGQLGKVDTSLITNTIGCFGAHCCSKDMTYDTATNKCVVSAAPAAPASGKSAASSAASV